MIQYDPVYLIVVVFGIIAFAIGFKFCKILMQEKLDEKDEAIKALLGRLEKSGS